MTDLSKKFSQERVDRDKATVYCKAHTSVNGISAFPPIVQLLINVPCRIGNEVLAQKTFCWNVGELAV